MPIIMKTTILLVLSNVFMTFAWYAHLKNLNHKAWYVAAFASWGIALFEYLIQVHANRIGYGALSLPQLKIIQEVVTLSVFVPFASEENWANWGWSRKHEGTGRPFGDDPFY